MTPMTMTATCTCTDSPEATTNEVENVASSEVKKENWRFRTIKVFKRLINLTPSQIENGTYTWPQFISMRFMQGLLRLEVCNRCGTLERKGRMQDSELFSWVCKNGTCDKYMGRGLR